MSRERFFVKPYFPKKCLDKWVRTSKKKKKKKKATLIQTGHIRSRFQLTLDKDDASKTTNVFLNRSLCVVDSGSGLCT